MSSNGNSTGSNRRAPISFGDLHAEGPTVPSVDELRQLAQDVAGTSTAVLVCAATAVARVQDEIDDLWRDSVRVENESLSERLVGVSHALQRAARLLEQERSIG